MPTISGYISAVQEGRFRLLTDDGRTFLLTLSHHAALDGQDLCGLQGSHDRVTVEFEGPPNLASAVAYRIQRTGGDSLPRP
jgi:hypothetical protein